MGSLFRSLLSLVRPLNTKLFPVCFDQTLSSTRCKNIFHSPYLALDLGLIGSLNQRGISHTTVLLAEPLKKKKKLDPAVVRAREERKKRKLEKQIRRMEKHERQLKPIDENEVPACIIDDARRRSRKLPQLHVEVADARWRLVKEWSVYKTKQVKMEILFFHKIRKSQQRALEELQKASPTLYERAIEIDTDLLPYEVNGPTETPPHKDYVYPNGDYFDVSKKWE